MQRWEDSLFGQDMSVTYMLMLARVGKGTRGQGGQEVVPGPPATEATEDGKHPENRAGSYRVERASESRGGARFRQVVRVGPGARSVRVGL